MHTNITVSEGQHSVSPLCRFKVNRTISKRTLLFPIFIFFVIGLNVKSQTVTTQFGQIQGTVNGTVYQFLGIPFAKPPVDSLRWRAPVDPDAWAGILNTTGFAPVCPQKKYEQGSTEYTLEGSEDCLYLNIWTPQTEPGNRPVLVFIHGGGNQQGGASQPQGGTQMYFGKNLAERGNAVVVTIQYRLGPLGFLVHPGLERESPMGISGNYAVLDQLLALTWVRNNIAGFGGDPSKVMIFGESAGGVNVGNLLTSPLGSGLFQRACIQSASPVINDYQDSRNQGIAFVDSLASDGTDLEKIARLRALNADSLIQSLSSPLSGGRVQMNWQPVLDHYVFTDFPIRIFQSGNYNKVPLMIGSNSEEMSLSAPATVLPGMVTALISASVPGSLREEALNLYPPGNNSTVARESYVAILTDAQFTATARRTAQCIRGNQSEPVWRYFFTHKHTLPLLESLGSYHGMELFYIFNTWEDATLGSGILFKPQDDSVQRTMLNYWVNFANTGNPNGSGLVHWPEYKNSSDCYLEIKATPDGSKTGIRSAQSDLWDNAIGFTGCTSSVGIGNSPVKEEMFAFPNPTMGRIYFTETSDLENWTAEIYDFTGRKILSIKNQGYADLSGFPAGIYLVKLVSSQMIRQLKIIRQ